MSRPVPVPLTPDLLAEWVASHPQWSIANDHRAIRRHWQFADFTAAFAFMTRVALLAERLDHHPDWRNVYGRVEIMLSTHDAGGVTERDLSLADLIDSPKS